MFSNRVGRFFLLAAVMCTGFMPDSAFACSCAAGSLEGKYEGSDNVFTAVVTGGEATGERVGNSPKLKTFFDVTETFKGTIPFEHFSSHADGNSCGISLQVGVEYLVFAPDTGKIGLCSGIAAVSGVPEQGEAIGQKYVAALRAFKSGHNDSLAEPWHFIAHQGLCRLSGRFPYGERKWPGSISVTYWSRMPDAVVPNPDRPHLKPGFTEMSIWVPGRDDLTDYPLTLSVNDRSYTAQWDEDEHSRARYLVDGEDVPGLIAELADASELLLKSAHPEYGDVEATASMLNAGNSVALMRECLAIRNDQNSI